MLNLDHIEEEESAMVEYIPRPKTEYVPNNAPHERAYWVDLTAKMLQKPFNQIIGLTRDWPVQWLQEMYAVCKQAENPSRLWWGLRKKNK